MAASHKSLSIPDLLYHSNQIDFDGMRELCAEIMPYKWSHMDEPMVWFEMESNARYPAFHTGCVMGKSYFMKIFRDVAMQKQEKFVLREFIDEFLSAGMIPMALTRWEMTGQDDELKKLGLMLAGGVQEEQAPPAVGSGGAKL